MCPTCPILVKSQTAITYIQNINSVAEIPLYEQFVARVKFKLSVVSLEST